MILRIQNMTKYVSCKHEQRNILVSSVVVR